MARRPSDEPVHGPYRQRQGVGATIRDGLIGIGMVALAMLALVAVGALIVLAVLTVL